LRIPAESGVDVKQPFGTLCRVKAMSAWREASKAAKRTSLGKKTPLPEAR
jgi:hypothetical protein